MEPQLQPPPSVAFPSHFPARHTPSSSQAARSSRGGPSTVTHLPSTPATSQAWHWPAQRDSQQRPWTQWPLAHWSVEAQASPVASLATHLASWQR